MHSRCLTHLTDSSLESQLSSLASRDCIHTADLLAHMAEFDARRRFAAAGYPSMSAYCRQALHMSKEVAFKRIRVARIAHQFPAVYDAIADSRLHVCAVVLLASHLTPEYADDLLAAAFHKTESEIGQLLAERFPSSEWMTFETPMTSPEQNPETKLSARTVETAPPALAKEVRTEANRAVPVAPGRFGVQCMVDQETQDLMSYAKALVGESSPAGQLPQMMKAAFAEYVKTLEKKRFAATDRPRRGAKIRSSANPRHIPAAIKNAVWLRDRARCTFTSESGHRCEARSDLQFDHIEPVARGGQSTVDNLRLRCHTHNQYEAERVFGVAFMKGKRETARDSARARRGEKAKAAEPQMSDVAAEVVPWLRGLGFKIAEANAAAASCDEIPDAPLETRVRHALPYFKQNPARTFAMTG